MNMNVFSSYFSCTKWHYMVHPFTWCRDAFYALRAAWHRATKGYCYTDSYNIDDWFLTIFPAMLRRLAQTHCGFPGHEPFDTPEKWTQWLKNMALNLEFVNSDPDDSNEYAKDFYEPLFFSREEHIDSNGLVKVEYKYNNKELRDKYWARSEELIKKRQEVLEETGKELFKYLRDLWD